MIKHDEICTINSHVQMKLNRYSGKEKRNYVNIAILLCRKYGEKCFKDSLL